jgi:hypothetical protein
MEDLSIREIEYKVDGVTFPIYYTGPAYVSMAPVHYEGFILEYTEINPN